MDLGCADGALAFVFESLGAKVHAIDNPPTNYNGMRGVKRLKRALGSSVRLFPADLDSKFELPSERYGLTLFLGILYHLKNPYGVLEALAARSRYCLLSTAVTRFAPDQKTDLRDIPLAYLAGRDGLKGDETNYWIFSEAGLRALVDRTGWDVCDWRVTADPGATLWGTQGDERVFCFLKSRAFEPVRRSQLLSGWHPLENNAWRWTRRRFSVALESSGTLTLKCTVPPSLQPPIRLTCARQGVRIFCSGRSSGRVSRPCRGDGIRSRSVPAARRDRWPRERHHRARRACLGLGVAGFVDQEGYAGLREIGEIGRRGLPFR